jgi:LysM repeat protein
MRRKIPFIPLSVLLVLFILSCASTEKPVQAADPKPAEAAVPVVNPPPANTPAPVKKPPPVEPAVPPATLMLEGAQQYRVVWGNTLSSISKQYYGSQNGYYFPVILLASKNVVSHPDVIVPGMVLTIPDLNKNLANPQARSTIKSLLKETAQVYEKKGDARTKNQLIQLSNSL